jgi:hypothetical protein
MLTLAPATFAQPRNDQRPDSFVDAASVAPGLVVEARYATAHNFVGVPIDGYEKPLCYLTKPAAMALAQVVQDLEARGLTVTIVANATRRVTIFIGRLLHRNHSQRGAAFSAWQSVRRRVARGYRPLGLEAWSGGAGEGRVKSGYEPHVPGQRLSS